MQTAFLDEASAFASAVNAVNVSVSVRSLTVRRRVPNINESGPSGGFNNALGGIRKLVFPSLGTTEIALLDDVTLDFPAGSSTLILGGPGSGKSSLLRALGGRLPEMDADSARAITYNGKTGSELKAEAGVQLTRLSAYAPQTDGLQQFLTVKEILQFCYDSSVADGFEGLTDAMREGMKQRVDRVVELLGLSVCKDVKIAMGVSGGQKRRTTIGEMLLSGARILLGDQITDGLDAAVAISVIDLLVKWTKASGATFVTALQAPPPEIFALFDRVVVLSEGKVLYNGAPELLEGYLRLSGYHMPSYMDVADYIISVATSPSTALALYQEEGVAAAKGVAASSTFGLPHRWDPVGYHVEDLAARWQQAGSDMTVLQKAADLPDPASAIVTAASTSFTTPYSSAQFRNTPHSTLRHTGILFKREGTLYWRNIGLVMAKLQQSLILSCIFGGVFYQVPFGNFFLLVSVAFFTLIFVSFSNIAEVNVLFEYKKICQRQISNGLYPALSYVLALITVQLPVIMLADMILSLAIYFMVGFTNNAGRFFFFYFVILSMDLCMTGLFKLYAILSPSEELAGVAAGAGTGLMLVYAGFFVPRQQLLEEGQTIPFYFFSPFSWALRSLSLNEFMSPAWAVPAPGAGGNFPGAPPAGTTYGQFASTIFGLYYTSNAQEQTAFDWKISGPFVLLGYFLLFGIIGCSLALAYSRPVYGIGTRRLPHVKHVATSAPAPAPQPAAITDAVAPAHLTIRTDAAPAAPAEGTEGVFSPNAVAPPTPFVYSPESGEQEAASPESESATEPPSSGAPAAVEESTPVSAPAPVEAAVAIPAQPSPQPEHHHTSHHSAHGFGSSLPFTPATLAFKDITYSVPDPKTKGKTQITLLRGINGYARPGSLTALMGASGAGKTTLLDVLAGRKNRGICGGSKTVNGAALSHAAFARISGYGEQFDEALPEQTVYESLLFSANLRMDTAISREQKLQHLEEVLDMLELAPVRNRTVGSLAPGERKRLTLGLEVAANAEILFADEPTTGLDSRAAAAVVRALRRVANSGRTVIATVHMPSSAVFLSFSHLILLAPGGYQIFSGPLGKNAAHLVSFFESIPGATPLPPRTNPATWMLEQVAAIQKTEKESALKSVVVAVAPPASPKATAAADVGLELATTAAPAAPSAGTPGGILAAAWQASPNKVSEDKELAHAMQVPATGAILAGASRHAAFIVQLFRLVIRGMAEHWRSPNTVIRLWVFIFVGIFFAVSFLNAALPENMYTQTGGLAKIGVLFSTTVFAGIVWLNTSLPNLYKTRPTFYRERAAGFYDPTAYSMSLALSDIPFVAFFVLLYSSICYFAVGLAPSAGPFFTFVVALYFLLAWYHAISLWISAFLPNIQVASIISGMTITMSNLFAGINIPPIDLAKGWLWLYDINGLSKTLQLNSMAQFDCSVAPCPVVGFSTSTGGLVFQTPLQWASDRLFTSFDGRWKALGWQILIITVFHILATIGYRKIIHQKR